MNDEGEAVTGPNGPPSPPGATPGVPGWYPDPFSTTRLRWWTGQSWTFTTDDAGRLVPPAPAVIAPPPPPAPSLPPPVPPPTPTPTPVPPPAAAAAAGPGAVRRFLGSRKVIAAAVLGVVLGLIAVRLVDRPHRSSGAGGDQAETTSPSSEPSTPTTADPSTSALAALVVKPSDVGQGLVVTLLPGGAGLSQPTLDLCNGRYPSETLRTARLQDHVVDGNADQVFSTEAVLYRDSAATTQAFKELRDIAAACPTGAVPSPVGEPTVATRFGPAPDVGWPQTPTVNRLAFDFTVNDSTGQTYRTIAVYLQRGRALLGVYFAQPNGPQPAIAGAGTIPDIVGVFAARMAALPASVVGS